MALTLREAGLKRVNISLDTLDREKFERMTRRDELVRVLDLNAPLDEGRRHGHEIVAKQRFPEP